MGIGTSDDEESPLTPSIPSFASLRSGPRRSASDVLLSGYPVAGPLPAPRSSRAAAARPPEWADLWHLGLCLVRRCVQQPITVVRRLIG